MQATNLSTLNPNTPATEPPTRISRVNGVRIAYWDAGRGPAVLLLHGFPDSKRLWRHCITPLVTAGYRVVAPDLRGFGESDRPEGSESYVLARAVEDVLALLDLLDVERTHVVSHDWGAAVAWAMAMVAPSRLRRHVALTVGHPAYFQKPSVDQRRRSWYMLLFQFEGVAEALLQQNDWALFREFTDWHPECEQWLRDLARPGALTAALNWYRANMHPRDGVEPLAELPPVAVPTLGVWASCDIHLAEACVTDSASRVRAEWRYERLEGVGHWIPLDAPDRLLSLISRWLTPDGVLPHMWALG